MSSARQVLVFPAWRDNPYLNLMGLAPRASGIVFLGTTTYDGLIRSLTRLERGDVLHVHWTTPLLQSAADERSAWKRLERITRAIDRAKDRGVSLVWTVHNRMPHELAFRSPEEGLYRMLGEKADAVHVMSPATREVLADVVDLDPRRIVRIPHPSYEGIYETGVSRAQARASFAVETDEQAALFLGQIRPYKGVSDLIEAAELARRGGSNTTLLLGGVVKEMPLDEFSASIPSSVRAITRFDFVPDDDIARWFRAADVVVLPYRAILNSGSLHLAATFRVPVLLPDEPHLVEEFGAEAWVSFFDRSRAASSLAEALRDAGRFAGLTEEHFASFLDGISPWDFSRAYSALLGRLSPGLTSA